MENNPLVSVIMNCYNCEKYLKEAIESVLNQTYQNLEIIFWDNQSTDNSAKIVKSYDDSRIRYFYAPKHTSLGEGRNYALKQVKGEFISFLDCDDMYMPTKIEKTLECFTENNIGLVYTNGYTLFENGKKKIFYKHKQQIGYVFENWLSNYNIMIPSVMFRTKVLDNLEYWFDNEFNMIEEFDFFMRIVKEWKVNYCHEIISVWRAHSQSLTWSKQHMFEIENKKFLSNILKKYPELEYTIYIKKFKAKVAYQEFFNNWNKTNIPKRNIIKPYIFIDKRLLVVYIFSFFGLNNFKLFLKLIGKSV